MTEHEAVYKAQQHDALCLQWYKWIRASKGNNMENESKRLVAQTETKKDDLLRNISLPCGPEHDKVEALAVGITAPGVAQGWYIRVVKHCASKAS